MIVCLQQLPAILICFRTYKFGISADIEKTFLHVQLYHADHDFTFSSAVLVILRVLFKQARTALSEANFNLQSWASNSKQLLYSKKLWRMAFNLPKFFFTNCL